LLFAVTGRPDTKEYHFSEDWGNVLQVALAGYSYGNGQAMEPFISRDGKWFFFNSRNVGDNTSLQYGAIKSPYQVNFIATIGGEANGPIPHLDAVPAMTDSYDFFWVSTRNYPQDYENLQHGIFDPVLGTIPKAEPVHGDFYIRESGWIVMDQEINRDGSILFYVNALFSNPPGDMPLFSNISLALRNPDGSFSQHPNAIDIMKTVNLVNGAQYLRYGPSSTGTDGLKLYFTVRVNEPVLSALYVANRNSPDEPFGTPQRITLNSGNGAEPEAPTLSADGNLMMYSRMGCVSKYNCSVIFIYKMDRLSNQINIF